MSKEPKRMQENVRGSSKLIVYISVAAVIAIVIISYVIIANMIGNKREAERWAEREAAEKQMAEQEALVAEAEKTESQEEAESVSIQIGKTVEESAEENKTQELFKNPCHNYTKKLISSSLSLKSNKKTNKKVVAGISIMF